jgi:hypothetical protein
MFVVDIPLQLVMLLQLILHILDVLLDLPYLEANALHQMLQQLLTSILDVMLLLQHRYSAETT